MASDEAGSFGCEKDRGPDELLEFAETTHGSAEQEFFAALGAVEQPSIQVCTQDAGNECVDANAIGRPFDGQRLGEGGDGGLAGAISSNFKQADQRGKRADVDDAPVATLDHVAAKD